MNWNLKADEIGERIEKWCAHWLALPIFTTLVAIGLLVSFDLTNVAMSYFTIVLLLLTLGRDRRDSKAVQAKLDDLDPSKAHLEDEPEEAIDANRTDADPTRGR